MTMATLWSGKWKRLSTSQKRKGMGEGGAIAPLPALANAVSDALAALGVSVDSLPLSPERVRQLVEERERVDSPEAGP